ncbi:hypothetical protein OG741_37505 [Streptomyces sp. NBC_01410]|uniref:hypothetical protein n=1 Tax=Streptomyces sp. NBC_01410 TaxID=2903856 RepID=UPI00324718D1
MSSWMFDEEREAFARLVLLELFDQAMCEETGLGEVSDLLIHQGGRPSGRPPAGACLVWDERPFRVRDLIGDLIANGRQRERLLELVKLINKETKSPITSAEARRVAEIAEAIGDLKVAYRWWCRAAASGDEDARDYLEILKEDLGVVSDVPDEAIKERRLFREQFMLRQVRVLRSLCSRERVAEKELNDLFGEIEQFLSNPDQVADGGRRI